MVRTKAQRHKEKKESLFVPLCLCAKLFERAALSPSFQVKI
jgi:hypothetical protein